MKKRVKRKCTVIFQNLGLMIEEIMFIYYVILSTFGGGALKSNSWIIDYG